MGSYPFKQTNSKGKVCTYCTVQYTVQYSTVHTVQYTVQYSTVHAVQYTVPISTALEKIYLSLFLLFSDTNLIGIVQSEAGKEKK